MTKMHTSVIRQRDARSANRVTPPPRGVLAETAYQYVKAMILDGKARPGDRLNLHDIIAALSSSRQPIMTALQRISAEGFVDITPQSGCRVSIPNRTEIADFFRAFAAIEGVAAEMAAERCLPDAATSLRGINRKIGELASQHRLPASERAKRYRRLNQEFHRRVHELGHSGTVTSLSESFWDRADFYITTTIGFSPFATRIGVSFKEHEEIVSAIRRKRSDDARRLMEAHIRAFAETSGL